MHIISESVLMLMTENYQNQSMLIETVTRHFGSRTLQPQDTSTPINGSALSIDHTVPTMNPSIVHDSYPARSVDRA